MTQRKRLEGALAEWHPHPKSAASSLVPVVKDPAPPDEVTERFFADAPEAPTPELPPIVETSEVEAPPREAPAVLARRRYLMRYVAGAVSLAALIGIGALVRVTSARGALRSSMSVSAAEMLPPAASPPDEAIEPPPEVAAAPPPAVADSADEPSPNATDPTDADPKAARAARVESLHELELGHFAASIEAGERSVSLDPADADAWLILGAAYQKRGAWVNARRCFTSCVHLATRGDHFQCWALLR
jgi:hypothetical protein